MANNTERIVVGIDLGTTNTLATYMKNGKIQYFKFGGSSKMLPSVLYVEEDGSLLIGDKAKKKGVSDPNNCIKSSKTYMGDVTKTWKCRGKTFTPTDVATEILKEVRRAIIKKMKCKETTPIEAVITIPAYFTTNQTEATRKAGIDSGFKVRRIVTEPMAAAVAAINELEDQKKLLVVDLGGGTFDLSVLEQDKKTNKYVTISTGGNRHLGGDDFDRIVLDRMIEILDDDKIDFRSLKASGLEFNDYYSAYGRLQDAAELAKIDLTDEQTVTVNLDNLYKRNGKSVNFECEITREDFDALCQPLHESIMGEVDKFVKEGKAKNKFTIDDIGTIVLAGGSCYIPRVQTEIEEYFGKRANSELDRSFLVVKGAGLIADSLDGLLNDDIHIDILSHSLGVKASGDDGSMIFSKILDKGTEYPCDATEPFTTTEDYQTAITVEIYEAVENEDDDGPIEDYEFYGSFVLDGIESAKHGVPKIDITFAYDKDRCLTVTAEDMKTHSRKEVRVKKGVRVQEQSSAAPMDIMLLIDGSGSMGFDNAMQDAKQAAHVLVDEMIDLRQHAVGLIKFASYPQLLSSLTHKQEKLSKAIEEIYSSGSTDLSGALQMAEKELSSSKKNRIIIIVTDGDPDNKTTAENIAEELKKDNVRIIAIGAGAGARYSFLKTIANNGDAYHIADMKKLKETFREVVQKLTRR